SVVRALIEHNLLQERSVRKFYYIGPMFRYERPQAGRQRQFYQIGVEFFGVAEAFADAEVISLFSFFLQQLGFKRPETKINSVGCPACRQGYNNILRTFLQEHSGELCVDCQRRAVINPLRVFDCKEKTCHNTLNSAPRIRQHICDECQAHFAQLIKLLDALEVQYIIDDNLVRGFDYYTRTVFETTLPGLGAQNAVMGGGRYDNLVAELGGEPTPGIGASFGVERLVVAMKAHNLIPPSLHQQNVDFYIIALDELSVTQATLIADRLRRQGRRTRFDCKPRSLKSGLKAADRNSAKFAIIIGENELKDNKLLVRNLANGEQHFVQPASVQEWLGTIK
ncbi:MAG: histidine--tRNA ligase, partial [Candidatus Sumerlaeia bacterium]|nr:histidine--tRNA ligase [Candidatus Sumerlaeia bacterium]